MTTTPPTPFVAGVYGVLKHVLAEHKPAGTALEFGVGTGTSTRIIAQHMPVIGFDSFEGLPENWRPGYPKGAFRASPPAIARVRLVTGLYADTLPWFDFEGITGIGLVHVDCDLYLSTATAFEWMGPWLRPGTLVVFDEYHGYLGAEDHEQRAWLEWADRAAATWTPLAVGLEQLALRIDAVPAPTLGVGWHEPWLDHQ